MLFITVSKDSHKPLHPGDGREDVRSQADVGRWRLGLLPLFGRVCAAVRVCGVGWRV